MMDFARYLDLSGTTNVLLARIRDKPDNLDNPASPDNLTTRSSSGDGARHDVTR
jgi:hypothetical protein